MKYSADNKELLTRGSAPVLLEPVITSLQFKRKGQPVVTILDHSGNKTNEQVPLKQGWIHLNGEETKTMYYLLEWNE